MLSPPIISLDNKPLNALSILFFVFFPNLNEKCEVNIIAVKSPHGEDYPAYGIIMNEGFDIEDVKMKIDELINNISINIILENSIKVDSISWESIKAKVD
jgi:hypothetical protein